MKTTFDDGLQRCSWVPNDDPLYIAYHDEEWGQPCRDDGKLFEMLCLEGAQAGLSWVTILKRRDSYRAAFDDFDPRLMAGYDQAKKDRLLQDAGIIRNRLKVEAFIANAQAYLQLEAEGQTLSSFLWAMVDNKPLTEEAGDRRQETAAAMSKELKKRGFRFVGPTICYAFMQACGLIDDHEAECLLRTR